MLEKWVKKSKHDKFILVHNLACFLLSAWYLWINTVNKNDASYRGDS